VRGIAVEVKDLGTKLQLTNHTGHDLIVLGYDREPYLRVGPRGVFENTRSPATYLNRTLIATAPPPRSADATAPPQWKRIGGGPSVLWHDHRLITRRARIHRWSRAIATRPCDHRLGHTSARRCAHGDGIGRDRVGAPTVAVAVRRRRVGIGRADHGAEPHPPMAAVLAIALATISLVETLHVLVCGARPPRRPDPGWARAPTRSRGWCSGCWRWPGCVERSGRRGAGGADRHHLPLRAGGLADATTLGHSQYRPRFPVGGAPLGDGHPRRGRRFGRRQRAAAPNCGPGPPPVIARERAGTRHQLSSAQPA